MNEHVKEIITDLDKLSNHCFEIDPKKDGKLSQEIILALKGTMREKNLQYLTAPQIGYDKRIFCIRFGKSDYVSFVNPVIANVDGITLSREDCLSLPGKEYIVPRNNSLTFMYMTPLGKIESREVKGKTACLIQHCITHLDGGMICDYGLPIIDMDDPDILDKWNTTSEEEREEIINMYMESLDIKQKNLEKEIESDPELKETNDAIKFMSSVLAGETTLERTVVKPIESDKGTTAENNSEADTVESEK